jgi:superfamily I DNA/RNA helicase
MKELTRGAVVMAGDNGQSLYNFQSPFERAGMNMRGNTRILKTNFRNTRQIHQFAEAFRAAGAEKIEAAGSEPFAFREGPLPEVYSADSADALLTMLGKEVSLYIDDLGYDPENICILVPRNREIAPVIEAVGRIGCECCSITAEDFNFSDSGRIRVSTLHSSKGLDFPVIILYLPYLHRRKHFDEAEEELMLRNLVYVGITRAMDNALLFTCTGADPILHDLRSLEETSVI